LPAHRPREIARGRRIDRKAGLSHPRREEDQADPNTFLKASDEHYVILNVLRDKLNLGERTNRLFDLVDEWRPVLLGYEAYTAGRHPAHPACSRGEELSLQHPVAWRHHGQGRQDPPPHAFRAGPDHLAADTLQDAIPQEHVNLIDAFVVEEYAAFPVRRHDDMLACLARILDPKLHARWARVTRQLRKGRGHLQRLASAQAKAANHDATNRPYSSV
jgi:hypothetical protein